MSTDARPAIVGAASVIQRPGDWTDLAQARGPIELMVAAARGAAEDAGSPGLLERVGWIGVAAGYWKFQDPGAQVAEQIGAVSARTALAAISGTAPQELVALAAERIAGGELDVALIVGGEARWSSRRAKSAGVAPSWLTAIGDSAPEQVGGFPAEMLDDSRALGAPAIAYALFEDSLRVARGDTIEQARTRIGRLWSEFSEVASTNPFAWDRTARTPREVMEPTADNRMIAFPYPKACIANNTVDMASAIIVCSAAVAKAAGVPDRHLVYPQVSVSSHETWTVGSRHLLHETPALAAAGRLAYEVSGFRPADIDHVDLYACFPSIVQMSSAALGLADHGPLTQTGGLGFAGAPVANSSGHGIVAITTRLRDGGVGLVHANGGNATKHAIGIYAADPPAQFRRLDAQDLVDLRARPVVAADWSGSGAVEAATVAFDRDGPSHLVAAFRTSDGARGITQSSDSDLIARAMTDGLAGVTIHHDPTAIPSSATPLQAG